MVILKLLSRKLLKKIVYCFRVSKNLINIKMNMWFIWHNAIQPGFKNNHTYYLNFFFTHNELWFTSTCKSAMADSYSASSEKFSSEQRLSCRIAEIDFVMRSWMQGSEVNLSSSMWTEVQRPVWWLERKSHLLIRVKADLQS